MTKFAKICAVLLFVPVVILTGYMVRLSGLAHFEKVEIAVEGYDPKDFFSGYYVALQPNWQRTDCSQFADNACPKKEFAEVYSFYVKEDTAKKLEKAKKGCKILRKSKLRSTNLKNVHPESRKKP